MDFALSLPDYLLLELIPLSLRPRRRLELRERPALQAHAPKDPALLLNQVQRRVELGELALVEHDQPVVVDDRPQAVRDGEQHRAAELLADRRLDLRVRREVDAARRLVEHDDRAPPQERARHRDQLPLPLREVRAPGRDLRVERDDRLVLGLGGGRGDGRDGGFAAGLAFVGGGCCAGGRGGGFARGALGYSLAVRDHLHTLKDVDALCVGVIACRGIVNSR